MNGIKFKNYLRNARELANYNIGLWQEGLYQIRKQIAVLDSKKLRYFFELLSNTYTDKTEKESLIKKAEEIEDKIFSLNESVKHITYFINSFDNDKSIRFIDKIDSLMLFVIEMYIDSCITINEASEIIGSAIAFNAAHLKKCNLSEKQKQILKELGKYYNLDGSFTAYENGDFLELFKSATSIGISNGDFLNYVAKNNIPFEEFANLIENLQKSVANSVEEKAENDYEEKAEPKRLDGEKLKELRKYYKNKELIEIPNDLEYFKELLNACQIDEKEQYYIFGLIKRAIKAKIPQENISDKGLQESILDSCSINTTNLIFLKDPNGNNYFLDDLDQFNSKYQEMIMKILSKINHLNKINFRPVIVNSDLSIKLYEVYSSDAHVIFYPLEEGIYLVIGASCVRGNYDRIINRFTNPSNKAYIEEIKNMLQNPEEREKLLAETVYPPELGQKRTRQI